jgi:hypothetical protein
MLVTGVTIFLAFWLLWIKLPLETRLRALAYPFLLDLTVSVAVFFMYGGTGEGMIAATLAAVVMSANISMARKLFGYIETDDDENEIYQPGILDQSRKLK